MPNPPEEGNGIRQTVRPFPDGLPAVFYSGMLHRRIETENCRLVTYPQTRQVRISETRYKGEQTGKKQS